MFGFGTSFFHPEVQIWFSKFQCLYNENRCVDFIYQYFEILGWFEMSHGFFFKLYLSLVWFAKIKSIPLSFFGMTKTFHLFSPPVFGHVGNRADLDNFEAGAEI